MKFRSVFHLITYYLGWKCSTTILKWSPGAGKSINNVISIKVKGQNSRPNCKVEVSLGRTYFMQIAGQYLTIPDVPASVINTIMTMNRGQVPSCLQSIYRHNGKRLNLHCCFLFCGPGL